MRFAGTCCVADIGTMDPTEQQDEIEHLYSGDCWAVHRLGDKYRFDVWSENGEVRRCVPMKLGDPANFIPAMVCAVECLRGDAAREHELAHGVNGMASKLDEIEAEFAGG